jgi:hypothetical protein
MAQNAEQTAETAKDTGSPTVDTSVLPELPLAATTAAAFPVVARNSTLPAAPPAAPAAVPSPKPDPNANPDAPGQTKWVILAALIITGAVVGTILLIHGLGGDDHSHPHPPAPTGTIITAGTPAITTPAH